MQRLLSDLSSGIRMLVKYPALSVVAILTLGLGIGLSTTVFCVVNGGLFKGLPFPNGDRIASVFATNVADGQPQMPLLVHDFAVYEARRSAFEQIGPFASAPFNLSTETGRPERYAGGQLSLGAFRALGVQPLLGRGFEERDVYPGAEPVMLLGHELWTDRYAAAPDIVGRTIRANGERWTVIGVMPARFAFPVLEQLWVPLRVDPLATPRAEGPRYRVAGLLKDGVSADEAAVQLSAVATRLAQEFPETNRGVGVAVRPYTEVVLGSEIYALLFTMLGAGIGVLLIACVNVSNLLIARASLRRREVAVRMALGAARGRIIRQHLTEVLVLATAGGAVGVLLSVVGLQWFIRSPSSSITGSCCSSAA